jgi:hypothetical protein
MGKIDDLKKQDNVLAVINDKKQVNGKFTRYDAVVFLVKKKGEYDASNEIPETIDNKPTDVVEVGEFKMQLIPPCDAEVLSKRVRPLRAGLAISTEVGIGTLAGFVQDQTSKVVKALTAAHVAHFPINQSGFPDTTFGTAAGLRLSQGGEEVLTVDKDIVLAQNADNIGDASRMDVDPGVGIVPGVMGLTNGLTAIGDPDTVYYGATIYKTGATTGVTKMKMIGSTNDVTVSHDNGGSFTIVDAIVSRNYTSGVNSSLPGDSGSGLYVEMPSGQLAMIGILTGATEIDSNGLQYVIGTPIDKIMMALNFETWNGDLLIDTNRNYVGAGLRTIYIKDKTVFSNATTGIPVYDSSNLSLAFLSSVFTRLNPSNTVHKLSSSGDIYGNPVSVVPIWLDLRGNLDSNVSIVATLESSCGSAANTSVKVTVSLETETLVEVGGVLNSTVYFEPEVDCTSEVGIGVLATCDTKTSFVPSLVASASFISGWQTDTEVYLGIVPVSSGTVVNGLFGGLDTNVVFLMQSDMVALSTASTVDDVTSVVDDIDYTDDVELSIGGYC